MYTVYILQSQKDKRTYVGYTDSVERRLEQHNSGRVKSTKARTPLVLWYKEDYSTRQEAMKRETYFKTSSGRRQLKKILSNIQLEIRV